MVCREVRLQLLAPSGSLEPAVAAHLEGCETCARLAGALGRLDVVLCSALVATPAEALKARLAGLAAGDAAGVTPVAHGAAAEACLTPAEVSATIDRALRAALVVEAPAALQAWLAALAPERAFARIEDALRSAVVVGAPAELQARLAALTQAGAAAAARIEGAVQSALVVGAPANLQARLVALAQAGVVAQIDQAVRSAVVLDAPVGLRARLLTLAPGAPAGELGWLPSLWRMVRTRPAVFAGQLAALAVLAYALMQVATWLGTLPVVLGDIPYALELLVLSPAVDYLGQFEGVVQQLGLWLLVGAAGWLLAQGLTWQRREPTP